MNWLMRHFTVALFICSVGQTHSLGYEYLDYNWNTYNGHQYAVTLDSGTWLDAEAEAQAMGGHLVTINGSPENEWLYDTFKPPLDNDKYLWMGLHQPPGSPEPAGGWQWRSGEPVTFSDWVVGEPNDYGPQEDYGTLRWEGHVGPPGSAGGWVDWDWRDKPGWWPVRGIIEAHTQPSLFGVLVGSNDKNLSGRTVVAGQADATAMQNRLRSFSAMYDERTEAVLFNYDAPSPEIEGGLDSDTQVQHAIKRIEGVVEPGDTFVFFFSGHGAGGVDQNESLGLNEQGSSGSGVSDDTLTSWFDTDKWDEVNKLFIMDSCHAGGFGTSLDKNGAVEDDLMGLPRTALLAACSEDANTRSSGEALGRGFFTLEIEKALTLTNGYAAADKDENGLTFQELEVFLTDEYAEINSYTGYIKLHPASDEEVTMDILESPSFYAWKTEDFEMSLTPVPEPSTLVLLAMGAVVVLACAFRRGRRNEAESVG